MSELHPRIGSLLLDGRTPRIAVSFDRHVTNADLQRARASGVDLAELRIDHWPCPEPSAVLSTLRALSGLPLLATIRHAREGGAWSHSEARRLALFEALTPHVDAIDVELSAETILVQARRTVREHGKTLLISSHDFTRTPSYDALQKLLDRALEAGADVVKIATMAHSDDDVQSLARLLLANKPVPLVTIAMGKHGIKSRVFFPALGSRFTFAAINGKAMAPGQLPLEQLTQALETFYR